MELSKAFKTPDHPEIPAELTSWISVNWTWDTLCKAQLFPQCLSLFPVFRWRPQSVIKCLWCLLWASLNLSCLPFCSLCLKEGCVVSLPCSFVSIDVEGCHPPVPYSPMGQTGGRVFHCLFESPSPSSLDSAYSLMSISFLYWTVIKTHTCSLLLYWRSDLGVPSSMSTLLSSSPLSDSSPDSMFISPKGGIFGMDPTYSFFPVEFSLKRSKNSAPLFHFFPCQIRGWCRG